MNDHQYDSDKYVCANCLNDEGLRRYALKHGVTRQCNYCGATPIIPSVVPLDDVTAFMDATIAKEWGDPAVISPAAQGEFLLPIINCEELFWRIGFEMTNTALNKDILQAFSNAEWCENDWQLASPSERWIAGWTQFQNVVMHERRYSFWYMKDDGVEPSHPDHLPPADVLGEIGAVIGEMKIIRVFPVGTVMWRLQTHEKNVVLSAPERFASPPIDRATQPNRMSPAGVPMFYGADDFETAFGEIIDPSDAALNDKKVTGVQFRSLVPLNILDLTSIPTPPSYFTVGGPLRQHMVTFLSKYAEDLSLPIERDEHQHIKYIPTQVFTEYIRHIMRTRDGQSIHGIRYASSKNKKPCYVIFATQAECLPTSGGVARTTQKLEYIVGSMKTVSIR